MNVISVISYQLSVPPVIGRQENREFSFLSIINYIALVLQKALEEARGHIESA
ncbi:MAG: hypothetical protein F6K40_26675 [Okeania sp. SIO3I5]|uniref:hypothetical protein n=1 Tax=Okeania sp. SIO3I5 TaxID=2607805 RepID=UPI0013BA8EF1|nr:hypothetical protein [Okeania sp. SIO3I5]NEQ39645.1 hypothetical protein [Okeania sp. SIO3I5]